jgi:hypothetical protein
MDEEGPRGLPDLQNDGLGDDSLADEDNIPADLGRPENAQNLQTEESRERHKDTDNNRPQMGGAAAGDLDPEVMVEVEATLEELRITQSIIATIRDATLADGSLPETVIQRLRTAENHKIDLSEEPELLTGIEFFINTENASEKVYTNVRETYHHSLDRLGYDYNPIPSLFQLKRRISDITGVYSILHDMCPNTCIAYTGPFSDLEICPKCQTTRYDPMVLASSGGRKKVAQRQFHTIPLGPQLQALFRSPEGARAMHYRHNKTAEILAKAGNNNGVIDEWSDVFYGNEYLDAVQSGKIKDGDIVLLMSIDGAQLYQSKESDCWIYIWVILDLSPDKRYKKNYVLPGGFIPGPNNPKNVDSFLLPGFHHVSALMKEGLSIWDAEKDVTFVSEPYILLGAADGPGLAYLNGLTGHSGAFGCRLYCPVKGRRKADASHYYPALLKPQPYFVEGCDHPDVNGSHLPIGNRTEYKTALNLVLNSRTQAQHTLNRKNTGITKPSIFDGFPENHCLGVCYDFSFPYLVYTFRTLHAYSSLHPCLFHMFPHAYSLLYPCLFHMFPRVSMTFYMLSEHLLFVLNIPTCLHTRSQTTKTTQVPWTKVPCSSPNTTHL